MTTSPRTRRGAMWSAPVLTAAAVAVVAVWPHAASASAHPKLPARTAAQLLTDVQGSDVRHFSGTIVETAQLGLPSLPGVDSADLSWQTFVTGSHTMRVWFDGPERQRIALLAQLSESDVIHNGNDVWTFASDRQLVGHATLTDAKAKRATSDSKQRATADRLKQQTPAGVADQALKALDPSTKVAVDRTQRVAGRPAYTLVLQPRDTRSTVRQVTIAIDSQYKLPLRVQVFGAAAKPALEIGFTDISFAAPSTSTFRFTPPRGATVTKQLFPMTSLRMSSDPNGPAASMPHSSTKVVGSGWTSVLVVTTTGAPGGLPGLGGDGTVSKMFVTQPDGSRLLQTALINVLMTPDGRTAIGAVAPSLLRAALA